MHAAFRNIGYALPMDLPIRNKITRIFERLSSDSARSYASFFIGLAVFVAGTLATYIAQSADRPVSAALIYVSAVTIIGAVNGLRGGLLAGIGASFFYNFFFSEPLLDFGVTTSDEYIPLVAFNLSALLSGALAGRINDRARTAEIAQQKINLLLDISNQLQTAVNLEDIDQAIVQTGIFDSSGEFEIYAISDEAWIAVNGKEHWLDEARRAVGPDDWEHLEDQKTAYLLSSSKRRVGLLICSRDAQKSNRLSKIDFDAVLNLLSMAVDRFVLLHQKSEAEAMRRSEAFKTALLSSISHDMRTPLAAISASASSLAAYGDTLPDASRQEMLTIIQDQCERLNRYTTNLLNLGRLQAGISPDQLESLDLVEMLGSAVNTVKMHHSGREIIKSLPFDDCTVRANPVMLEQLFYNILENAVQYSPGDAPVLVTGHRQAGRVEIAISDQGCGIPASELNRVFDRFYRSADNIRKEGHGLGLSIAAGFARAFGGDISAHSPLEMGRGTKIIVQLPASTSRLESNSP
ncbi:sensor histidine kinase [Sphingorhabdus sp. SMR4y]|uniref:sensor histidine kinase n=1 Tax=Sphingorhabdus sp. SMR4y TaxID=2584094 RepID=UPI000B5CA69D|nr:ATP-binding protein [Sphingorhabdus sp. SMR4y]